MLLYVVLSRFETKISPETWPLYGQKRGTSVVIHPSAHLCPATVTQPSISARLTKPLPLQSSEQKTDENSIEGGHQWLDDVGWGQKSAEFF